MNKIYILVLVILPLLIHGQSSIKSTIINSTTKQAISYCNVFNQRTQNGVISNTDGEFLIEIISLDDIISISFLGYETKNIQAKKILNLNSISLKEKQYQLQEVEINSSNDYLYDILINCRRALKKNKRNHVSKAFFILNSSSNHKPLELLECYYNASQKSGKLEDLYLKNGRLALRPLDSHFFFNFSTTQVFNKINLVQQNDLLPAIILQFRKGQMRKYFNVKLEYRDSELFNISFIPKKNNDNLFSGEIWIDKKTYFIRKISLSIQKVRTHPFEAFHLDSLAIVSLNVNYTFGRNDTLIQIDHIGFNMKMNYYTCRKYEDGQLPVLKRNIKINSILYFYDFDKPFLLPYFDYNNKFSDYRKLSTIPYNQVFWQNRKLLLTKDQKKQVGIIGSDGVFINYDENNYGTGFLKKTMDQFNYKFNYRHDMWSWRYYYFWTKKERIFLKKDIIEEGIGKPTYYRSITPSDMYSFGIQIFLDINHLDGAFDCKSLTIFDLSKTFYKLEINKYSNAFVNIYFDICEIERREMQKEFLVHNTSLNVIDSIYNKALINIEAITSKYKKEVQRGNNVKMLKKWNDYVFDELGIDNFEIFQL